MDDQLVPVGTVDPEVRAHVTSLVSALGGTGSYDDGRYVLGDDGLAVLKDIKRWLKLYDEKLNRLDVARVLAERNLVKGDLLEILSIWPEDETDDKLKSKIALACVELLVPLTWPIEKSEHTQTANHLRNIPYLELAQIGYKREILDHDSSSILRTAVRIALPSIALPMGERTSRDEGIIKLILYFFRNVAMISAPAGLPVEWNENEVSRSATIEAFAQQDIFNLILTIASNMGEDFNTQDVVLLELMFHLIKGVETDKLFLEEVELEAKHSKDLRNLMSKEADMLRGYRKDAPTRHNRFGTMIWVKRDDERMSAVSGQDVLTNGQKALAKMDQTKKWSKPRQRRKEEQTQNHFDLPVPLTNSSTKKLRSFVEDFLDSGFNPLMTHLRKAIEREADRVLESHTHQFFYLTAWFLQAERARRNHHKQAATKSTSTISPAEPESYGLVASVLNQETFILLNRYMQDRLDHKVWHEVNSGMRAFTQTLLMVQEMTESPLEDDQEIAENIQNRIFYEETTHDRILSILRGYKDQGFSYLDACTELSHVFLRLLEHYSKENGDLQIRSRRRARQKKKQAKKQGEDDADPTSEAEDEVEAQRISRERKFDLGRFTSKFINQHCVDTFVAFLQFYKDFSKDQLKRAHRFFYRVAFKQEMSVMLFRLDIIALFNRMIKGPEPLGRNNPMYKEWDEFVKQLFRRLTKKLQARPELAVELLFSKINATAFYLEYGYEKQTITSKPRAPAELEIKGSFTWEEQVAVAVAALHEDHSDAILWLKKSLENAADERQSWEAQSQALISPDQERPASNDPATISSPTTIILKPDNDERRVQLFKLAKLRLLLGLCGMECSDIEAPDATWSIPSALNSSKLREIADLLEKHRIDPTTSFGENGASPEELIRRKSAAVSSRRERAEFDDESDGIVSDGEEEFMFEVGPKPSSRPKALEELKKKRRKRRSSDAEPVDEAVIQARKEARKQRELEKRRGIKSAAYINDSSDEDEEADKAFFEMEEKRRKVQANRVKEALKTGLLTEDTREAGLKIKKRKAADDEDSGSDISMDARHPKRARSSDNESSDDEQLELPESVRKDIGESMEDDMNILENPNISNASKSRNPTQINTSSDDDEDEDSEEETPLSSQSEHLKVAGPVAMEPDAARTLDRPDVGQKISEMVIDEEEEGTSRPAVRRRGRVAAILDDSDED